MFYKVKKAVKEPAGLEDTQRLMLVLSPEGQCKWRLLIVGKKRLPTVGAGGTRQPPQWALVHSVAVGSPEPVARVLWSPGAPDDAARPCAEGAYGIYRHGSHVHLAYVLSAPGSPEGKDVQASSASGLCLPIFAELGIRQQASFLASVKNPTRPGARAKPHAFAAEVFAEAFGKTDRAWVALDPPELLDAEGAELLLVADVRDAAALEGREIADAAGALWEGGPPAEIALLAGLGLDLASIPLKPLFKGKWA
eukprot:m51a1_g7095 hypothetical protein (252) ;mRNA; r:40643-41591